MLITKKRIITTTILAVIIGALVYFRGGIGSLFQSPTAYAIGDLTVNWGVPEGNPIFTVASFAPGQSESRDVNVTNGAPTSRPVGVRGVLTSDPNGLASALDIVVSEGLIDRYGGTSPTGPKTLAQFMTDSLSPDGISLSTLGSGANTTYTFKVTFMPGSGNEFQNTSVVFDLRIGISVPVPAACGDLSQYPNMVFGTAGNDRINGTRGNDLIFGLEGNDTIDGGLGKDCIVDGPGNDNLVGSNGNDVIVDDSGNNRVDGGNGNDMIITGSGNDTIIGGNDGDTINAGDGNNVADGGNGNDTITTGSGNDKIIGGNGDDEVHAGGGNDSMDGGNGNDKLFGEAGTDSANGGNGKDTCVATTRVNCEL